MDSRRASTRAPPKHESAKAVRPTSTKPVPQKPKVIVEPASPSPAPTPSPLPRAKTPVHEYDGDIDRFLEYMAHPTHDIFRNAETEDDDELRDKLTGAMEAAMQGRLSHWEEDPKSTVALVILLDQIPRRVYQGRPQMYDGDVKCQEVIFRLVRTNQHLLHQIKPTTLLFVCIALSHHEDSEAQSMAHQIWKDIKGAFSKDDAMHAEKAMTQNREIVEEFGRFPNRNRLLSRASNTHEQKYLERLEIAKAAATQSMDPVDSKGPKKGSRKTFFGRRSSRGKNSRK